MSVTRCLRLRYLLHLSKPASDRTVYRAVHEQKPRRILELGMGAAERAVRTIEVAAHHARAEEIHYVGVDLFESRSAASGPGVSLKTAYRLLRSTGAAIRLLPGDPLTVLSRFANELGRFDLVVIAAGLSGQSLGQAWYFVPRILHGASHVLLQETRGGAAEFREVPVREVEARVQACQRRRVA
ncbi:MAG: hypothetical protein HUU20_23425 [Pirellulales bacterium]|nr:hypothetical protein [Pirellulales bacterium]